MVENRTVVQTQTLLSTATATATATVSVTTTEASAADATALSGCLQSVRVLLSRLCFCELTIRSTVQVHLGIDCW